MKSTASKQKTSYGERLEAVRRHLELNQTQFAQCLGVSRSTVYEWKTDRSPSDRAVSVFTANLPEIDVQWLDTGEGEMLASTGDGARAMDVEAPPSPEGGKYRDEAGNYRVRQFGEVGAGPGRAPIEEVDGMDVEAYETYTPKEYIARFGSEDPADVGEFTVKGDSASPEYFHGESVPVKLHRRGPHQFEQDLKYIFRWDNSMLFKRLRLLPSGTVRALSLNPTIDPFEFEPDGQYSFAVKALVIESQKQQMYSTAMQHLFQTQQQVRLPGD